MRVIACSVLPPPDATNVAYAFQEGTAERIGTEESSGVVEQSQAEGLEEKVVDTQLYPDLNLSHPINLNVCSRRQEIDIADIYNRGDDPKTLENVIFHCVD